MGWVRDAVLSQADHYLGVREGSDGHREIVALYNSQKKRPRGYVLKESDAWCAAFLTALGVKMSICHILLPECGVGEMVKCYKKIGRWSDGPPQKGDLVVYDWGNDGRGDHIGMVQWCYGRDMRVLEGNYKNAVTCRELKTDDERILGYCHPDYESLEGKINSIQQVQVWLNVMYFAGLKTDGIFGKNTCRALICALQTALGVEADGIFGQETKAAVKINNLRLYHRGELTQILQAMLICRGFQLTADGSFGPKTEKQLISFQKRNALTPDGVAGTRTFEKLIIES